MQSFFKVAALVFIALGFCRPIKLCAQGFFDHVYVSIAGGANWLEPADLKELFGPVAPGSEVKFDVGSRTDTTVGYKLTDWTSVELDLASAQNSIRQITGARSQDAELYALAVLLNGKLRWPNPTRFTPYIGAGVGGSGMLLSADSLQADSIRASGVASDFVWEYQALAGARFAVSRKIGLSLEYRFTAMESSDFRLPNIDSPAGRSSDHLRLGQLETHTVSLGLSANF